jgi:hypothetical protein
LIQQQKPQIASVIGSVSQLMHAGHYYIHAITHASSGYKSQRRDRNQGKEKRKPEERPKLGGGEKRDKGKKKKDRERGECKGGKQR